MIEAEDILRITRPEDLFSRDRVQKQFKLLAKRFHPDHNNNIPLFSEVFSHILSLKQSALNKIANDTWGTDTHLIKFNCHPVSYQLRYLKQHPFELGEMYIGRSTNVFVVHKEFQRLSENFIWHITHFKFANDKMKTEFSRYLPELLIKFETDNRFGISLKKSKELILLKDLISHSGGKLDPKHMAWITSSLYNLSCYLYNQRIAHCGIDSSTYFIEPKQHYGVLLGGWYYATRFKNPLKQVSSTTYDRLPHEIRTNKIANPRIDLTLIKALGVEMLGGAKELTNVPKTLSNWLKYPSGDDAYKEYESWMKKILPDSFGPRRYTEMKIMAKEVYGQ